MSKKSKSRKSKRKGRSRAQQKKSNTKTFLLIGAVAVIAIAAVALLVVLDSGSDGTQPSATQDSYLTKYLGAEDAPVVVVEYSDFQCPYCRAFAQGAGEQLREEYVDGGDVRFVYRHLASSVPNRLRPPRPPSVPRLRADFGTITTSSLSSREPRTVAPLQKAS